MDTKSPTEVAFAKRVSYFKRVFARGVGKTPSALQKMAMQRAALLAAEAERALSDPTISINDKIRLDGAARRARVDMNAVCHPAAPPERRRYGRVLTAPTALDVYAASRAKADA